MFIFLLIKYFRLKKEYEQLSDDVRAAITGCYSTTIRIPSGYRLKNVTKSKKCDSVTIEVVPNKLSFFEAEIKKLKEREEEQVRNGKSIDDVTVEDLQNMGETDLKKLRHYKRLFDYQQRNMKDDNANTPTS